jgi:hypothetical protein
MAGRFQISCITKPDRQSSTEHITHVGGYGASQWKLTVETVIERIEGGLESFFVHVGHYEADVVVMSPVGRRKYIRTEPDLTKTDNLLSLPPCP